MNSIIKKFLAENGWVEYGILFRIFYYNAYYYVFLYSKVRKHEGLAADK